ncbi:UDP-glucosyltransferase 2 [Leptinotarsa decemlineata]|uniref:UDP-glucosyltransferase 2 n=1 Tax=Leptinotarsa decemlineata TaxID=7539 RepID=UPI003D3067AF
MFHNNLLFFFLSVLSINPILGGNVLILDDVPTAAQQIFHVAIGKALAAKGHNVTIAIPNSVRVEESEKLHVVRFEGMYETATSHEIFHLDTLMSLGPLGNSLLFVGSSVKVCDFLSNTKGFRKLLNYPNDFKVDLIIINLTLETCLLPLIQKFNYPPTIASTSYGLPSFLSEKFGSGPYPSFVPFHALRLSNDMTFLERLQNYFWTRFETLMRTYLSTPSVEQIARNLYGAGMDSYENLLRHISLVMCNLIPGFHYSRPISPNIITAGGLHVQLNATLPKDLQEIMDTAEHGVILVSFGSNVRSASMGSEKIKTISNALSQLKETVIWKFESELDNLPKNIFIRKWLPQMAILAHPNLKLFVGHGGGMSTTETVFFGVPLLGMPFMMDQLSNMDLVEDRGIGRKIDFRLLTTNYLLENIREMLDDPKYFHTAKKYSRIARDQPQKPLDLATFWAEFAMRHNGTHFLNPQSRYQSLFVSSSTDVYLFLLFVISVILFVSYKFVLLIKACLCQKKKNPRKVKKN